MAVDKRVLVTGARGFVGRHAIEPLLGLGYEVHAVGRGQRPTDLSTHAAWHDGDLLDTRGHTALFKRVRPSHLLHFAWYATHGSFWTSVENFRWTAASLGLLIAFHEAGGGRVVCAGTCAEYDWRYGFCSEDVTPLHPLTPYGGCKNALREMLHHYAGREGLSWAWGRLFHLYGPHEQEHRLVPSIVLSLLDGSPAACGEGRAVRDYLYVEDAAHAFVTLLDGPVQGPVNVASGLPVAISDLVARIATSLGRPELIEWGARPARLEEPPLLVADVRRLNGQVGWRPRLSLDQGLARTIDHYQALRRRSSSSIAT